MRHTETALHWIVEILNNLQIPFEIDGGMAAEAYGSGRELADIDINIPENKFNLILPFIREYITFGPDWYKDEHWNLYMVTLRYAEQYIDIGSLGQIHYYDHETKTWLDFPADMSNVRIMPWMGMNLPFVNEIKLMIYKQRIGRGVDKKDVRAMETQLEKEWKL